MPRSCGRSACASAGCSPPNIGPCPSRCRDAVVEFFDRNERWLSTVLDEGRSEGSLRFRGPARDRARLIVGTLEGALLVARPYGDRTRFEAVARQIVEEVAVGTPATSTEST